MTSRSPCRLAARICWPNSCWRRFSRPRPPIDSTGLRAASRGHGERLGAAERVRVRPGRLGAERGLGLASAVCERYGYEPVRTGPDSVRLRNCPFHPLAARAPELVCAINREFLSGMLTGLGARAVNARLEARPAECCVELHRA
jgi:predicted ArsR family transcriptional regulator